MSKPGWRGKKLGVCVCLCGGGGRGQTARSAASPWRQQWEPLLFSSSMPFLPPFSPSCQLAGVQGSTCSSKDRSTFLLEVVKVREKDGKQKSDKDTLEKDPKKQVYKRRNVIKTKWGDEKDFTGRIYKEGNRGTLSIESGFCVCVWGWACVGNGDGRCWHWISEHWCRLCGLCVV